MITRVSLKWNGGAITDKVRAALAEGLFEASEHILEEANKMVPHDEGALEASGETSVDRNRLVASVSYDKPYAARLHEHPEYDFQESPQRRGKWLEVAWKAEASTVAKWIADKVKAVK